MPFIKRQKTVLLLSVIIVNYNVRHFLEQCLYSLVKATGNLESEVIVVDNNSIDDSVRSLQPVFPYVRFIANKENVGFAKACNQGLKAASGKLILFLNPDTVLAEDSIEKTIEFLASNANAGAVGIKMVDGSGKFLKESKRSFPSPLTSLFKLTGLSKLFPRSALFSRYHLGHLDADRNHEVDVLAGAYMMIKREVLEETGGFDEAFFMYGEDIDLSYRIQNLENQATGQPYRNYYFSESAIIHFKGESTKRGSFNYVRLFYTAMSIFARKHYGGTRASLFNSMIHFGIWTRAVLAGVSRFIRRIGLPLIDAGLILLSFWMVKSAWSGYVRPEVQYDNRLLWMAIPAFTILYLLAAYYAGLYDRWYRRSELVRSTLIATIVLLAAYSLLPEHYRFSRAIILFGAILSFILIGLLRRVLVAADVIAGDKKGEEQATTVVVASPAEFEEVLQVMKSAGMQEKILGRVAISEQDTTGIGQWSRLYLLGNALPFREVIFCEGQLAFAQIIETMQQSPGRIKFKLHAKGSHSIVGSDSKDSSGEALSPANGYRLADPYNRRLKRLLDVIVALQGLLLFPLQLFAVKKPFRFFVYCVQVFVARKTWVGYAVEEKQLPLLRHPVLACNGVPGTNKQTLPAESLHVLDYWYARDYEPVEDLKIIWRNYRKLGS